VPTSSCRFPSILRAVLDNCRKGSGDGTESCSIMVWLHSPISVCLWLFAPRHLVVGCSQSAVFIDFCDHPSSSSQHSHAPILVNSDTCHCDGSTVPRMALQIRSQQSRRHGHEEQSAGALDCINHLCGLFLHESDRHGKCAECISMGCNCCDGGPICICCPVSTDAYLLQTTRYTFGKSMSIAHGSSIS